MFAERLVERKGVKILLKSFEAVLQNCPEAHLWILGDGPQKDDLTAYVQGNELEDKVTFTGTVENVTDYFSSATLCVFPSLYGEGLMSVVAEAMMSGACVITSSGMGSEELIQTEKTGILVPPAKQEVLSAKIIQLLKNDSMRERIKVNARKYAQKNLSWENVSRDLYRILRDIVSK